MAGPTKKTNAGGSTAIDDRVTPQQGRLTSPPMANPASGSTSGRSPVGGDRAEGNPTFMARVQERAGERLSTQKDRAAEGVTTVAHAVRQTAAQLREAKREPFAKYVDSGAQQLERFSEFLRNKDAAELWRDAQAYARRRPAVFVGSAFAVGLLAARFLKSSGSASNRIPAWQRDTTDRPWKEQITDQRGPS
jgi:hypothetical protein